MPYPTQGGVPDLYDANYLPTLYAATLLFELYKSTVIAAVANTDYEGMIQEEGSEIKIRTYPDIPIHRHTKGQELNIATPNPSSITFAIEKGLYWAFKVESIDEKQSDIRIRQEWAQHAGELLKIETDAWFLSDIYGDVSADNMGATAGVESNDINLGVAGTPFLLTSANVVDYFTTCGQVLDEQNVPDTGRWFIIPPWIATLIKQSDLKDASLAGDGTSIARNGRLGMIDRFTLYMSNNLTKTPADSATNCIFGHPKGVSFAAQMTESKSFDLGTAGFGTAIKQLMVFDWHVTKPECLGHAYVAKG